MASTLPETEQEEVLAKIKAPVLKRGEAGPLKCLLNHEKFEEVHLLSNYPSALGQRYVKWLGDSAVLHQVKLNNPTDYPEVFNVADAQLAAVVNIPRPHAIDLCLHLSPGTPTMTAIWLLLGKSKYQPATFYQTHENKAWVTTVPFDLIMEFVPQVIRDADARLQALASQSPRELKGFEGIVGESRSLRVAAGLARRAATRDVSVLLLGESGTGKEKFAQAMHDASPRREEPFVSINCAAISRELLESELFGHKKALLRVRSKIVLARSKPLIEEHYFRMKSVSATRQCKQSCSGFSSRQTTILAAALSFESASPNQRPAMFASFRRRTAI